jgi:hypothetical protein
MQTLPRVSRRVFLRRLAATGLSAPFVARGWMAVSPNGKLRHASFGATGMAWADVNEIARHASVTVVAAADVDLTRTAEFKQKFPEARIYQDWRELLEKETDLDTVNVSTPDHMHAPMAMSALQRGKHVYEVYQRPPGQRARPADVPQRLGSGGLVGDATLTCSGPALTCTKGR